MNCEECENEIPYGKKFVYHTAIQANFCDDECADEFDKQFRLEKVNDMEDEETEDSD